MFSTILIANRGEIACRVIRTCQRMGIRAIAVYSDADKDALHVAMADTAIPIGGNSASESYLNAEAVLATARESGAEAVHPGYGFLSENADFAEACQAAGITFIGPPTAAIRAMGSKSAAKTMMGDAGVPILPGYHGDAQDMDTLREAAAGIGYPVLLKPSAGGGGRGMRLVERAEELDFAVESARREAASSFGDDTLLIEKYLAAPRHVEIQVFADNSGNTIHLFERDCSVQRRHQKVIEEAPAPGLSDDLRAAMGKAAIAAARAVGYAGAGTVEFLLDEGGGFYFMEMNTRLQVEHPVTEMITGLDLVEWQLRVAAGEKLPADQKKIRANGHAIEVRLYAEDPEQDFIPAAGRLSHLRLPEESDVIRIDSGVREGDSVTAYYDPMIAKLIAHGTDRAEALDRLRAAMARVRIAGLATNAGFLATALLHPEFAAGGVDTGFIERHAAALMPPRQPASDRVLVFAALAVIDRRERTARMDAARTADRHSPWAGLRGWRLNAGPREAVTLLDGNEAVDIEISGGRVSLRGRIAAAESTDAGQDDIAIEIDGMDITVFVDGATRRLRIHDALAEAEAHAGETETGVPPAPMPGVVVAVLVEPGAKVEAGMPLMVIEAMKVEHTIRAAVDGTVDAVHFKIGDRVDEGARLVAFTPDEPDVN